MCHILDKILYLDIFYLLYYYARLFDIILEYTRINTVKCNQSNYLQALVHRHHRYA